MTLSCCRQGLPDRHGAGPLTAGACRTEFAILTARPIAATAQRAAGTQSRTIQQPRAPWTWIRARDRYQPWITGVPRTPVDGHAGERCGGADCHGAAVN